MSSIQQWVPPPNIHPLAEVLQTSSFGLESLYSMLICPICSGINNHVGDPRKQESLDDYKAWRGRGNLLVVPFAGECGSAWEICFGFHKGETDAFVRVSRSCTESSYLYFIEAVDTGFIKIGRSANPQKRLAQLATGSPNDLRLLGKISGGSSLERELHVRFGALRERGEWFRVTTGLRQFILEAVG